MCPYPLVTGQVTKGHLQFPSWLTPPMAVGAVVSFCPQTHTAVQRGSDAALCALMSMDPCILHPKLPSLSSSQKALGIVRPGCAQEAPLRAQPGLLLGHYPSYSSGSVLCLASFVNSLGTGSLTKEDPNRIRDTSAVAQPAQWAGIVLK